MNAGMSRGEASRLAAAGRGGRRSVAYHAQRDRAQACVARCWTAQLALHDADVVHGDCRVRGGIAQVWAVVDQAAQTSHLRDGQALAHAGEREVR